MHLFSEVQLSINNQQTYNSHELFAHKSNISKDFKGAHSEYNGALQDKRYDYEEAPDEILDAPLPEPFFQGEWKCSVDLMVSCCKANWGLSFSRPPKCCRKLGYVLSEPQQIQTWLAITPTLALELLINHLSLDVLLSRMLITREERTFLHLIFWSVSNCRLWKRLPSSLLEKTSSLKQKQFHRCSSWSTYYWKEYKPCMHWMPEIKSILVPGTRVQTIWKTQKRSNNCRL